MAHQCYNPRPMRHHRFVRFAAVLLLTIAAVAYLFLRFPADRNNTGTLLDFSEFYAAGQIVRHGLGANLYDLKTQAEFQLQVAPVHAFYLRPPFEALLFVPFTYFNYRGAYLAWTIFCLVVLFTAAWIIQRNTGVVEAMREYARGIPVDLGLLFVICLTFEPTMNCLLIGQDAVLMLFVYTLAYVALAKQRELAAGALLASGLFKFHLVLPFALIFLLRRRWSFLIGFCAVALLLFALSFAVSGPQVIESYAHMFLDPGYRKLMGFQPEYAANFRGLVYVLGGSRISPVLSAAIVALLSVVLLWRTATAWNNSELGLSFSAAVIASLLTGVHLFVYDLCVVLLPVAIVCGELGKRRILLSNLPLNIILLVLFIPVVHHLLIVEHVYAFMALALLGLFVIVSRAILRKPESSRTHQGTSASVTSS